MCSEEVYCENKLLNFGVNYRDNISGYIDIPVCAIGATFNVFNILVFTRKNMISPVNMIFTHLAIVDFAVLFAAIPFSWQRFAQYNSNVEEKWTYQRAIFLARSGDFIYTAYFMSIFLTLMLAIWRYIAVVHPLKERIWCNMKTTRNVVIIGYVMSILLCIPMYLSRNITKFGTDQKNCYESIWNKNSIQFKIALIIRAVLQHILPSVVLPIFSFKLIYAIMARKAQRKRPATHPLNIQNDGRDLKMKQQTDRSIIIMLMVVGIFLSAHIPTGINLFLVMFYGRQNITLLKCYRGLEAILTTYGGISLSTTFVVYYTMSKNFRNTFKSLFNKNGILHEKDSFFSIRNKGKIISGTETDQA